MNKIKSYIGIIIAGLMIVSCSESFLDVESKTESTTGNFYRTLNDANRALIGCYDGWQRTSGIGMPFVYYSLIMADECFGGTGSADSYDQRAVDRFDITYSPSHLNLHESSWERYYAAVFRCNSFIAHENQINWGDNTVLRGTTMGQCRAIRAILYFDMVRFWGNIPLFTEPSVDNKPQANPDEVFALIFSDLKYAIDNIPANAFPKAQAATNDGRITKYAAQALLARAYLFYTGYYDKEPAGVTKAEVLAGLEEIIESEEYSLIPEFKNLWPAASSLPMPTPATNTGVWDPNLTTYAGDGNRETVLAKKFNYTHNNDGNRWLVMMGMRSLYFSPYGTGWGGATVNPKMWNSYEPGDTRREASIINFEAEGITDAPDYSVHVAQQREYTGFTDRKSVV